MLLPSLIRRIDQCNTAISHICMWLILPLTGVMLFDAIRRYFFNAPTVWGAELGMMIFGVYMIFAGPSSILQKVQVGVDIFSSRWQPRTRAVVQCATYAFTLIFLCSLLYTAIVYAQESWELREASSSAWGQSVYQWKALIPVAIFLMLLQSLAEFLRHLYLACTGKELA